MPIFHCQSLSHWQILTFLLPITILVFMRLGLYRAVLRYVGFKVLWTVSLKPDDKEKYAIAAEPMLAERIEQEEDVKALVEMAQKLEGMTRNVGVHAGGVLIAPGKLTDFDFLFGTVHGNIL